MQQKQYTCPKCGNPYYTHDPFQATGGNVANVVDVQNKKVTTISGTHCGYTERYKMINSEGWGGLDFLLGG